MAGDEARRLDDGPALERADGDRGQEGRVEEVVVGRDNGDVVLLVVKALEEGGRTPAGAENDNVLLLGVLVELLSGVGRDVGR